MRRIDQLHLEFPFKGARLLRRHLQREGAAAAAAVGRCYIATLMLRMGIQALGTPA